MAQSVIIKENGNSQPESPNCNHVIPAQFIYLFF